MGDLFLESQVHVFRSNDREKMAQMSYHRTDLGTVPTLLPALFDTEFPLAMRMAPFGHVNPQSYGSFGNADFRGAGIALSHFVGYTDTLGNIPRSKFPATLMYLSSKISGHGRCSDSDSVGSENTALHNRSGPPDGTSSDQSDKIVNSFSQELRLFLLLKMFLFFTTTSKHNGTLSTSLSPEETHRTALKTMLLAEALVSTELYALRADQERWFSDLHKLKTMVSHDVELRSAIQRPTDLFVDMASQSIRDLKVHFKAALDDHMASEISFVLHSLRRGFKHVWGCQALRSQDTRETTTWETREAALATSLSSDDFLDSLESFLRDQMRDILEVSIVSNRHERHNTSTPSTQSQQRSPHLSIPTQQSSSAFSDDSGDDMMDSSEDDSATENTMSQSEKTKMKIPALAFEQEVPVDSVQPLSINGSNGTTSCNELFLLVSTTLLQLPNTRKSPRRTQSTSAYLQQLSCTEGICGTHYGIWLSDLCLISAIWHSYQRFQSTRFKNAVDPSMMVQFAKESASHQLKSIVAKTLYQLQASAPSILPILFPVYDMLSLVAELGAVTFKLSGILLFEENSDLTEQTKKFFEKCLAVGRGKVNALSKSLNQSAPQRLGLLYCCKALFTADADFFQEEFTDVVTRYSPQSKEKDLTVLQEVSSSIAHIFLKFPEGGHAIYEDVCMKTLPPSLQACRPLLYEEGEASVKPSWEYALDLCLKDEEASGGGFDNDAFFRAGVFMLLEIARASDALFDINLIHLMLVFRSRHKNTELPSCPF